MNARLLISLLALGFGGLSVISAPETAAAPDDTKVLTNSIGMEF